MPGTVLSLENIAMNIAFMGSGLIVSVQLKFTHKCLSTIKDNVNNR